MRIAFGLRDLGIFCGIQSQLWPPYSAREAGGRPTAPCSRTVAVFLEFAELGSNQPIPYLTGMDRIDVYHPSLYLTLQKVSKTLIWLEPAA